MNNALQRFILENLNTRDGKFASELDKWPEADKELVRKYKLEKQFDREALGWRLQGLVEKTMHEHKNYDDLEGIIDLVTKKLNANGGFQFSYEVIEHHVVNLFKTISHRKAFGELCESDVESYKLFVDDPVMFAEYVIRQLFTYRPIQVKFIYPVFEWIFTAYFPGGAKGIYEKAIKRLNYVGRRRENQERSGIFLNVGKAVSQGRAAKEMELPFIEAMEKIYIDLYEKKEKQTKLVTEFYKHYIAKEEKPVEAQPKVQIEEITLSEAVAIVVPSAEQAGEETTIMEDKVEPVTLDSIIAQLEQLKEISVSMSAEADEQEEKLKISGEEIVRLRHTIQAQEAMIKESRMNTYLQLIEAIGGNRSNYLLSELYKESMGESMLNRDLMQGQLLNFFNIISDVMNLEPVSNGYKIDQVFDCNRGILAQQFQILNSISGEKDIVRVKLLQYGWSINGKVLVQPLVTEVKEEL